MQREKRKLKVKQKRREEKMEKEINMVYLKKRTLIILILGVPQHGREREVSEF